MGLFTPIYETEEEFWRSVLTGEKPALPRGQVRKCFPYSHPMTGGKLVTFPLREHRRGFSLKEPAVQFIPSFLYKM